MPYLLRDVESDQGLCMEFLQEAIARMKEDDSIEPLFTQAMVDISVKLATMSMNDPYKPYIDVR